VENGDSVIGGWACPGPIGLVVEQSGGVYSDAAVEARNSHFSMLPGKSSSASG
jgi:hypothetical protein